MEEAAVAPIARLMEKATSSVSVVKLYAVAEIKGDFLAVVGYLVAFGEQRLQLAGVSGGLR